MQILAALHHRDRTGEGAYLEMSQYESSVRLMDLELADVLNGGDDPGRNANRSAWCAPHGIFPAARATTAGSPSPAATTPSGPRSPAVIGIDRADRRRRRRRGPGRCDRAEIVAALRAAGVPVSGVEDLGDHHRDPSTRAFWQVVRPPVRRHRRGPAGARSSWDGERLPLRRAPLWMEHTYDVLVDELGLDPSRFSDLIDAQVLW